MRDAFDRSVALVLGVNAYERGIPQLTTAVPDAEAIAALLADEQDFTTLLWRDSEVTCARVRAALAGKLADELGTALTEDDRLVIYVACHGRSQPSQNGPEGQLLLADADPADQRSFLAMSELRGLLDDLPCRHLLLVLDCCFAGTIRWAGSSVARSSGGRVYRETLDRFVRHRAWQVLVSASHDQTAHDAFAPRPLAGAVLDEIAALDARRIETGPHSPFADAMLRGLRGGARWMQDRVIVAAELELFVRAEVEEATGVHQTPQLYKLDQHDRGEFVFQVPGTTLELVPAPALALDACPYQGLRPYGATERERFFGRAVAIGQVLACIRDNPLTVVLGASGTGKSSLLAAGVVPALREWPGWTVIEAQPDARADETLRDLIQVEPRPGLGAGNTLLERITAWLSAHVTGQLCLVIDRAEGLEMLATAANRGRVLGDLATALAAHGARLRVVLALRSEFERAFLSSALAPHWNGATYTIPALAHNELREIIERPAQTMELAFEPPALVDSLIHEVLQAPSTLPLLSFALSELYAACVRRNSDRLLTERDYIDMGRLSGALVQRADALLDHLAVQDRAYTATTRRVFLRMVIQHHEGASRRRTHRAELVYADGAENERVAMLLDRFQEARLLVSDRDQWEPAHDWLVTGWPRLQIWCVQFGAENFGLQFALAEAARRWHEQRRAVFLWRDDAQLQAAIRVMQGTDSWLNARERAFVVASSRRRRPHIVAAVFALLVLVAAVVFVWDRHFRMHVAYYRDYVRVWGEPQGVDALTEAQAQQRAVSVKLVRKGRNGHIQHVELVHRGGELASTNPRGIGRFAELDIRQRYDRGRTVCQWDYTYESATDSVAFENARDRAGRLVYSVHYRSGGGRMKAEFVDDNGDDAMIAGDAERVELVRSQDGRDIEKHYTGRRGEVATNRDGVSIELLAYDDVGHLVEVRYVDAGSEPTHDKHGVAGWRAVFEHGEQVGRTVIDEAGHPVRHKLGPVAWRFTLDPLGRTTTESYLDAAGRPTMDRAGVAARRSVFDAADNEVERAYYNATGQRTRSSDGYAGWRSTFDAEGNEISRTLLDESQHPTRIARGYAGWRSSFDARGNEIARTFIDENDGPTRSADGYVGWRSSFDLQGNETVRTFLDEAGLPTRSAQGYAGWRSTFDVQGNETMRMFLVEAGQRMRGAEDCAGWQSTFDARGREVTRTLLDEAGKSIADQEGVVEWRRTYDERDNEIERMFYSRRKLPISGKDGYAGWQSTFDRWGNETGRSFVNEGGKPTSNNERFAGWRSTFDASGNETQRTYLDEASRPTRQVDRTAGYRSSFDALGHEIERVFVDEIGKPAQRSDGVASVRRRYDQRGEVTETVYCDRSGTPVVPVADQRDRSGARRRR